MNNENLKTPVVFIIFNRPDTTQIVFEKIREAKPETLFVIADGPRSDRHGEVDKCKKTRAIIDKVDWPCQVFYNYSDVNLGCKKRVSSGLDWVFDTVEEAIILEDDCMPDISFFRFCQELLSKYRYDDRIGTISGYNFSPDLSDKDSDYFFSKYIKIWGWASWRRVWKSYYDVDMKTFNKDGEKVLRSIACEKSYIKNKIIEFRDVQDGLTSSWAYPLSYACMSQNLLTVIPSVNLIKNIGFGPNATHTKVADKQKIPPLSSMSFPIKHPIHIIPNKDFDAKLESTYKGRGKWVKRLLKSVKKYIN